MLLILPSSIFLSFTRYSNKKSFYYVLDPQTISKRDISFLLERDLDVEMGKTAEDLAKERERGIYLLASS